jgi:hypothetical protein
VIRTQLCQTLVQHSIKDVEWELGKADSPALILLCHVREANFCLRIDIGPVEHSSSELHPPLCASPDTGSTPPNIAVIPSIQGISPPNIAVKPLTQGIGFISKSSLAKITFLTTYL